MHTHTLLRARPSWHAARRKVETKLIEMLNMRGRHKHKWDSLHEVLAARVVYDDNNSRLWMARDGSGQGLLYFSKQAQVRGLCVCGGGGAGVRAAQRTPLVQTPPRSMRTQRPWLTCTLKPRHVSRHITAAGGAEHASRARAVREGR
jgi:hypothetical protein